MTKINTLLNPVRWREPHENKYRITYAHIDGSVETIEAVFRTEAAQFVGQIAGDLSRIIIVERL